MKNKMCWECKYFVTNEGHGGCCTFICDAMCDDDRACYKFQKPTNRDKFFATRSDEELAADYIQFWDGNGMWCATFCHWWFETKAEALQANLAWLNAPAESEGEDE